MRSHVGWIVLVYALLGCAAEQSIAQEAKPGDSVPGSPALPSPPGENLTPRAANEQVTVLVHPNGTLQLRRGGLEMPFEPPEHAESVAKRLNSQQVTIQASSDTPMEVVRSTIELLKTSGATAFMVQPAPRNEQTEMKIFTLQYSQADSAAKLLAQLFAGNNTTVLADPRTNSLIVRGPSKTLTEIEALAARLDQPAPANDAMRSVPSVRKTTQQPTSDPAFNPGLPPAAAEPDFQRHNLRTQQVARQIQQLGAGSGQQREALQTELRKEVEAAFDARQRQQGEEIARLRQRLAEVEQSIAARQKLKSEIISHRVAELLDPNLQWSTSAAETATPTATSRSARVPPTARSYPNPNSYTPATIAPPAAADPFTASAPRAATGAVGSLILRNADDFARELGDSEARFRHLAKTTPRGFSSDADLATAERRMKAIQAEYEAQLKLLELELQNAQLSLEKSRSDLNRVEKLAQSRAISSSEVDQIKLAASQAQVRLEQLRTLLDLYRSVEQPKESNTPKSNALPAAAPSKPAADSETPTSVSESTSPIRWLSDLDAAKQLSVSLKRPMLIYFTAPWSHASTRLESEVLRREDVAGLIWANYVPVRLEYDSNREIAKELGAKVLPWHVVLRADGSRFTDFNPASNPEQYLQYMAALTKRMDTPETPRGPGD